MERSQPTTDEPGKQTSSRTKFRPAGPSEFEEHFAKWLGEPSVRQEVQTIMSLLECDAWQAVLVRQAARSAQDLDDILELLEGQSEKEQDWGPGTQPEEPDDG